MSPTVARWCPRIADQNCSLSLRAPGPEQGACVLERQACTERVGRIEAVLAEDGVREPLGAPSGSGVSSMKW